MKNSIKMDVATRLDCSKRELCCLPEVLFLTGIETLVSFNILLSFSSLLFLVSSLSRPLSFSADVCLFLFELRLAPPALAKLNAIIDNITSYGPTRVTVTDVHDLTISVLMDKRSIFETFPYRWVGSVIVSVLIFTLRSP